MKDTIPNPIHKKATSLFKQYSVVGGMPEAVANHIQYNSQEYIKDVYNSLFNAYIQDMYKYADRNELEYLTFIFNQAPVYSGQIVSYAGFGGSNYRSEYMKSAFSKLEDVMLLSLMRASKSIDIPITPKESFAKKLIHLDHGFLSHVRRLDFQSVQYEDLNNIFRGSFADQIVGQSLMRAYTKVKPKIYYWTRGKGEGFAEVDFCVNSGNRILGIKVKSGASGKLKSLFSFAERVKDTKLIRVHEGELKQEEKVHDKKTYQLQNVPFYMVDRVLDAG